MGRRKKVESTLVLPQRLIDNIYEIVQEAIDSLPFEVPRISVAEFAAEKRTLPPGTPYQGPWRNERTPYGVEIMESLSARSRIQEVIFVKCSQIGATSFVENFIGYIISQVPGPTLYVTSKEDLLKKWVNKRLTPLLLSCKIDDRIFAQHLMEGQHRSGNQLFSKEFPGGTLDMVSALSESNLRMDTIRYLILDEAGAYPWDVQGFGDPIEIARARTANFKSRRKIFIPSTPGREGECRMWPLYQEGDQRRFFIACPYCEARQVLKLPSEPNDYYEGFASTAAVWETKGGYLDKESIHFVCDKCKREIFEDQKYGMFQKAVWAPTAKPNDPLKRSYQISRLYSLMEEWERIIKMEIAGIEDPTKMQPHHNHNCGIPYRETAVKIDRQKVYELRGGYKSGIIPSEDLLFLTASVDVQRGSESDPNKPPRLEMEVCGHGYGYRTWSVLYKVFPGPVDDPFEGAWEDLYQFFNSGRAEFRRSDGMIGAPAVVFVDSGDAKNETTVFEFCARIRGFYPIKGAADLKESRQGKKMSATLDEARPRDRDQFRVHKKNNVPYIVIATNWYKRRLSRALMISIKRKSHALRGNMYCDFPSDYPDSYFDMLTAEEEREDQTFWKPSNRPNEALDLRVYNLCAGEFWLFLEVERLRKSARKGGMSMEASELINSKHVLDDYTKHLKRKDTTPTS